MHSQAGAWERDKLARKNKAKVLMAWAARLDNGKGYELNVPRSQAPAWECILPNNNLNSIKNHLKPCIKIIPITRITPML
jgi:hypothetical protein